MPVADSIWSATPLILDSKISPESALAISCFGLLACPVLVPVTAVTPRLGFEGHLGKAFAGLAGHDFVSAFGDLVQARRPPVKGEANSIEDRGLPRAGGAGDSEDTVRCEGRVHQVDLPFTDQ
jgi:hypothetical protein